MQSYSGGGGGGGYGYGGGGGYGGGLRRQVDTLKPLCKHTA